LAVGTSEREHDTADATTEVSTVRERLRNAHISETRIALHLETRAILLDGQVVTDLDSPAPPGTRINFAAR
jgi:hypothetical protein